MVLEIYLKTIECLLSRNGHTLPNKLKPGHSVLCEWTEHKANQIASEWLDLSDTTAGKNIK